MLRFRKKWIFLFLVLLAASVFLYIHFSQTTQNPFTTVAVVAGDISEKAEAVGYIKPSHFSTIKSQVNGTVAAIYHFEGEYVTKGTPLVKIDATPDPADYATAFEKLEAAIAAEKNATTDFERFQLALKKRLITANYSEYINAHKNYDNARFERILQGNIC